MRKLFLPVTILPYTLLLGSILFFSGLYLVYRAPLEALQGIPQKIFYLHVPLAWTSFLLFFLSAFSGGIYLYRKEIFWDAFSYGCAVGGFWALSGVLFTGPVWAKPIWGTFWVWEPRLTTTFLLWVIYLFYLFFRYLRKHDGFSRRVSAVITILAVADIPVIHLSVLFFRSLHPLPVVLRKEDIGGGLPPEMVPPLLAMFLAFLLLGGTFSLLVTEIQLLSEKILYFKKELSFSQRGV